MDAQQRTRSTLSKQYSPVQSIGNPRRARVVAGRDGQGLRNLGRVEMSLSHEDLTLQNLGHATPIMGANSGQKLGFCLSLFVASRLVFVHCTGVGPLAQTLGQLCRVKPLASF